MKQQEQAILEAISSYRLTILLLGKLSRCRHQIIVLISFSYFVQI